MFNEIINYMMDINNIFTYINISFYSERKSCYCADLFIMQTLTCSEYKLGKLVSIA